MLVNIICNAVKYTFKGTITVTVECQRDIFKVEVRDTGRGIEKLHAIGKWFGTLDVVENVN